MIQSEIKWKLGLSDNDDFKLREWIERGLAVCAIPKMTKGRLYDLTQRGARVRKQLLTSINEKERTRLLEEMHSTYSHFKPPRKMNLAKYSKVIASPKLKLPILAVLDSEWKRAVNEHVGKGEEKTLKPGIQSLLKNRKVEVNWSNLVDQLKEMTEIGVIEVKREKGRKNYYRLNEDGRIIKKWLHKINLINDGWV